MSYRVALQRQQPSDRRSQLQETACRRLESFKDSLRGLLDFLYLYFFS